MSRAGFCPESSGAVGVLHQGVTGPNLCFGKITLAAAWTLDGRACTVGLVMQAWSDGGLKGGVGWGWRGEGNPEEAEAKAFPDSLHTGMRTTTGFDSGLLPGFVVSFLRQRHRESSSVAR